MDNIQENKQQQVRKGLFKRRINMTNDEILYLVDRAYLVGFDIHKLTNMIRKGSTVQECIHALKENVQGAFMTFPEQ